LLAIVVVGLLIGVRFASVSARVEPSRTIRIQRPLMGTVWNIEVVDHGRADAARKAIDDAYAELERIDGLMSEWKPQSPLSIWRDEPWNI
jgi:thiamine biosynthesis lipoprotein ApbE